MRAVTKGDPFEHFRNSPLITLVTYGSRRIRTIISAHDEHLGLCGSPGHRVCGDDLADPLEQQKALISDWFTASSSPVAYVREARVSPRGRDIVRALISGSAVEDFGVGLPFWKLRLGAHAIPTCSGLVFFDLDIHSGTVSILVSGHVQNLSQ